MISIKGLRDGLLVVCEGDAWLPQLHEMEAKFSANAHFFKGGRIALDVKTLELTPDDLRNFQKLLGRYEVTLWAVLSKNERTADHLKQLKLPDRLVIPQTAVQTSITESDETTPTASAVIEGTDGMLVRRIVRSGQVLRHPGHIVVVGDVNPGAQLIAGHDIIVWGKMHGSAHAGALGDAQAVICALELSSHLLRIADAARNASLQTRRGRGKHPEMAILKQDEIHIVTWIGK